MKNVNIVRGHQFLGEGGTKKTIYKENCLKMGPGQFVGSKAKNRETGVFDRGVDTPMHTMN